MKILIKNISHKRIRSIVIRELRKQGLQYITSESGFIEVEDDLPLGEICKLNDSLRRNGLDVVFIKSNLADKIRHAVTNLIRDGIKLRTSISFYLSDLFSIDFDYLDEYFKSETGSSIEEYYNFKKESQEIPETGKVFDESWNFWHLRWWNFN